MASDDKTSQTMQNDEFVPYQINKRPKDDTSSIPGRFRKSTLSISGKLRNVNSMTRAQSRGYSISGMTGSMTGTFANIFAKRNKILEEEKDDEEHPRNFFINDFPDDFGFGVYLEYWKTGKKNSVTPKYGDLKKECGYELTRNRHAKITKKQYDDLRAKCKYILGRNSFLAEHIGAANQQCDIEAGKQMTVDHAVCVKLYTDFNDVQREFKKHCRRLYKDEAIQSVMERNAEIAHWCRLLKESVMFWGDTLRPNQVVHSGMNTRLMFHSLYQRFECPLSTSESDIVADTFTADRSGIRLSLKAASPSTRYLNVAPFSCHKNEKEWLFMGSTLKIVNIDVGGRSYKAEVAALMMLEQIMKGRFIDGHGKATEQKATECLLKFLQKLVAISVFDSDPLEYSRLLQFLDEQQYDSDEVIVDVTDNSNEAAVECSNICRFIGDDEQMKDLSEAINGSKDLDISGNMEYFWVLFRKFLGEMQSRTERGDLWINRREINKSSMKQIEDILSRNGMIQCEKTQWVQECVWEIKGGDYKFLRKLPISRYLPSQTFKYKWKSRSRGVRFADDVISFRFRMYRQHSKEQEKCAIFLELDDVPQRFKGLKIEMDMKCIKIGSRKKVLFRQWFQPRKLSNPSQDPIVNEQSESESEEDAKDDSQSSMRTNRKHFRKSTMEFIRKSVKSKQEVKASKTQIRGFQCFDSNLLEDEMSLKWLFGVKIFGEERKMEKPEAMKSIRDDEHEPSRSAVSASNDFSAWQRPTSTSITSNASFTSVRSSISKVTAFPTSTPRLDTKTSDSFQTTPTDLHTGNITDHEDDEDGDVIKEQRREKENIKREMI